MKNAAQPSYLHDDEEGSAENAAVLGADGGPVKTSTGKNLALFDDESSDDNWLDEELTDEELAALGGDDFDEAFSEDFDIEALDDLDDLGDLDDFDDDEDFELLEAPNSQAVATASTEVNADNSLSDDMALSDTFNDDFLDIEDDDTMESVKEDSVLYAGDHTASDHASDQFSANDEFSVEDDFSIDDEFSIDGDLNDAGNEPPVTSAAIVTVGGKQVRANEAGEVALSENHEEEVSDGPSASVEEEFTFEDEFSDLDDDGTYHRPVPRISIHAFCETNRNTALLERAAVDRRLTKAHFTMHNGGLQKAVDLYQSSSTPNLIVVETQIGGSELIQQLGQLAEVCDPSTKVILVGKINDIRLYRELIRQGISEYIVRPKSPLQIIKSISELYVDPSAPPIGKTIAFVGTRGGVGSSTLAHNMGWLFAEEHKSDTVILDLDLPFGTTALDFDHEPTSGLIEALTSPERLDDVLLERLLVKHTDHLSLLTAPNMLDRDYDIDNEAFDTVIDIVRGAAPTVVIDVPHNWTGWSRKILQTADEIVITATPDFASFRNMKHLMEVVGSARPNDSKPYFVYNQFDPKISAVPVEYFVENVDIEPSLILGFEPQLFNTAATNASSIIETSPKSKVAQGLTELSAKILGRNETLALPSRFSLTSLFKRK